MEKAFPLSSLLLSLWCLFSAQVHHVCSPGAKAAFPKISPPQKIKNKPGELFTDGNREEEREAVPWGWVFAERGRHRWPRGRGERSRGAGAAPSAVPEGAAGDMSSVTHL